MEGRRPGPSLLTGRRQVTQWAEFSPQLNSKSKASSMLSYLLTHFAQSASVVVSIVSVSRAVCRSDDWSDMSREPRSFIEQPYLEQAIKRTDCVALTVEIAVAMSNVSKI